MDGVNCNTNDNDDDDEPTAFELLFQEKDITQDVFYFRRIEACLPFSSSSSLSSSSVRFVYSLNDDIEITATMGIDFPDVLDDPAMRPVLLSIGMCKLLWYGAYYS